MKNTNLTSGSFPMCLYIIKDCHWNHNIAVKVNNSLSLQILQSMCHMAGFILAPRKVRKGAAV